MAPQEADISWHVLRGIVRRWAGDDAELESVTPLAGGSINVTLALTLKDGTKSVLKITPHRIDRSYADEAWQLSLLSEAGLPVPKVFHHEIGSLDNPFSYILMEFIDGLDLADTKAACSPEQFDALQEELARLVLQLHQKTHSHFQRATDGNTKQFEKWPDCYRDLYEPIWEEVTKSSLLPVKLRKTVSKIHERLDLFLAHGDCPRLMHWDLWSSNLMCHRGPDDQWHIAAFLDPHCKYGHCEAELAYLELFNTVTPTFTKMYQKSQRLPGEYYQIRRPIYQLYSMLNHLRLFGQEYHKPMIAAIDRVKHLV